MVAATEANLLVRSEALSLDKRAAALAAIRERRKEVCSGVSLALAALAAEAAAVRRPKTFLLLAAIQTVKTSKRVQLKKRFQQIQNKKTCTANVDTKRATPSKMRSDITKGELETKKVEI